MMTRPVLDIRRRLLERGQVPAEPGNPELIRDLRQDGQSANERQHEREPVLSAISHGRSETKKGATQKHAEIGEVSGKVAVTIGLFLPRHQTSHDDTRIEKNVEGEVDFWSRKLE
jgi:hypothetical protein